MEAPRDDETQPPPESSEPAAESGEERQENQEDGDENEVLMAKAQSLIEKITANAENPSPSVLHTLSTLLETEESRYLEEADHSSTSNGRFSHSVGRLGNLIRENDEFFELISSKYLTGSRYSISVKAASLRLLVICSSTWMYPHVFEDDVLAIIRGWVMEEMPISSSNDRNRNLDTSKQKTTDSEMLWTYSTGLLAVSLDLRGPLVEDVLNSGIPAKLMRYLRFRILGDSAAHQKDGNQLNDKGRSKHAAESSRSDVESLRVQSSDRDHGRDPCSLENPDKIRDRALIREAFIDGSWVDEGPPDNAGLNLDACDVAGASEEEKNNFKDVPELKIKPGGKSVREEECEENVRDDIFKRRPARVPSRLRGKYRLNDVLLENEPGLTSPASCSRSGLVRTGKDRSVTRNQDLQRDSDPKDFPVDSSISFCIPERDDNDDCFQECKVGTRDITDLVKKAVRAAEAEASAANASAEAIKAAGDDVAEMVKNSAFEEYTKSNDEDAAVAAASRAAISVIDAANAVAVARNSSIAAGNSGGSMLTEPEVEEDITEFVIPDSCALGKLREKFCILCLIILGEYVDVLGHVLHEKGVDVCLSLLVCTSKNREASDSMLLLPDVLKLICALAPHKKFSALFVDRGGVQRLLCVPRTTETFFGLSSCLSTIGSTQGIMERVCALPSDVIRQVVELALQLLQCQNYTARKNAATLLASGFVFRAVIDAFDALNGLQKLISLLHEAALVRSGAALGQSNNSGSLRTDRSPAEVLTSSEKQIAFQTCIALRQYFRAHLLLYIDTLRPSKNIRSAPRNMSRAAYKPLDISTEAMDIAFRQLQKDRKLGAALARSQWCVVDQFLSSNGHITMLELCQAPPVERYLHDLLQYALGVLHIVTLVPCSRKPIVNATLSNDRVGIAVILDAANGAGYVEPEIVEPALNVLINLVCPPPSISNKPSAAVQNQQVAAALSGNGTIVDSRDRNAERSVSGQSVNNLSQNEVKDRIGESVFSSQAASCTVAFGLVGDRRISLGAGAGSAGLAAQLEQGYRQARDAVRANNGIKVLLQLLQPRIVTSPAALDCLRALTCRVLLGLARDDAIAHILTKLQVGKKLSELIRDSGSQTSGGEQNRWQTELSQVTIELIGVVTNSGRATTLVANDAATPTLRRIERAAIAAATPISYHSWELLLLIYEHLQALGLADSAATLLKEAKLTPLPSLAAPSSLLLNQAYGTEASPTPTQWPTGRAPCGFMIGKPRGSCDSAAISLRKKYLPTTASSVHSKVLPKFKYSPVLSNNATSQDVSVSADSVGPLLVSPLKPGADVDVQMRTPILLPKKRKADMKESGSFSSAKRLNTGEHIVRSPVLAMQTIVRRGTLQSSDMKLAPPPASAMKDQANRHVSNLQSASFDENQSFGQTSSFQTGHASDQQCSERVTLDSLVVQYLKHQHRQCPAPITTLPPLSLLHPHVCPEPRRSLDAPSNVTSRLSLREFRSMYGSIHGCRKDRQFVYSRFRPWRTCRDDATSLLTCIAFLGDSSRIAVGGHTGELKVFDSNNNSVLESCNSSHQSPVTLLQSHCSGENQLLLSSSAIDVRLWDASAVSGGPKHSFEGIKAARFNKSGSVFAALRSDSPSREILLYDVHTCQLGVTLRDTSNDYSARGNVFSPIHFNPDSARVLWNGVLWDHRDSNPIRRFDQFTDYGGGGFHPAGNEVIINSEVWDLRTFRLLRSVPSLDQTVITFNASGDVIYAILRRNHEDVTSAFQNRRVKHPLFSAFRTVDAVNYSDIATIPVDRCVLDFATEPTDSFVGLITMDDQDEMCSSGRIHEIGRRKPTDDDSDPDDAESEEEDEDDEADDDEDEDSILDGDGSSDGDGLSNGDGSLSEFEDDDDEDDGDFMMNGVEFEDGGFLEIVTEGAEDDDSDIVESFSSGDEDELL